MLTTKKEISPSGGPVKPFHRIHIHQDPQVSFFCWPFWYQEDDLLVFFFLNNRLPGIRKTKQVSQLTWGFWWDWKAPGALPCPNMESKLLHGAESWPKIQKFTSIELPSTLRSLNSLLGDFYRESWVDILGGIRCYAGGTWSAFWRYFRVVWKENTSKTFKPKTAKNRMKTT